MHLDDSIILKRLGAVNQTQESVQTCSKWVLHHRESVDRIGTCWMELYKKTTNDKLRIALIYLLNDVVQKAANKRDTNVTLTFHPHWINATAISNVMVKKSISRCVEVLEQRSIYPPHIIEEMKAALVSKIATEKDESQSGEIDFAQLIRGIDNFYKNEVLTEKARDILARSSFNFKESVQARVKDRTEGVKALADMDASRQKMINFLESVEKHQQKGQKLMELMQQTKNGFGQQLRDVTIVNDAYEKFSEGIRDTRQQLETMEKSGAMLSESPPRDAPSPTAGDDPFLHGVNGEEVGGGEDMEMDDEDRPGPSSCFLKPSKEYVASIPPIPEMDPRLQRLVNQGHPTNSMGGGQPSSSNGIRPPMDPRLLDPRQARYFPPPQQPPPQQFVQPNFAPPVIPPPGVSPPPPQQQQQPIPSTPSPHIDTTKPPPPLFSVPPPPIAMTNGNNAAPSSAVSPSLPPMFNPANPPPSLLSPQMQMSPPPNFSIPPPGLIQPPPLSQFQPQHNMLAGGASVQKRRNSMAMDYDGGAYKQKRTWSSGGSGRDGDSGRSGWNESINGGRGRGWRRSFAGDGRRK